MEGRTGVPFVDANMRELAATGFMSNRGRHVCMLHVVLAQRCTCAREPLCGAATRAAGLNVCPTRGRQNVASYLVHDLGIDWRWGAEYFESVLIDSDVHSNWGNWNAAAGLIGGRINRFNITKQSKDYDPSGEYVRHWLGAAPLARVEPAFVARLPATDPSAEHTQRKGGNGQGRPKGKGRSNGGGTRAHRKSDFEMYG